jgi:hypothetical protein
MREPLKVGDRIYKFCSLEHKRLWDNGRKVIDRLNQQTEDF